MKKNKLTIEQIKSIPDLLKTKTQAEVALMFSVRTCYFSFARKNNSHTDWYVNYFFSYIYNPWKRRKNTYSKK